MAKYKYAPDEISQYTHAWLIIIALQLATV